MLTGYQLKVYKMIPHTDKPDKKPSKKANQNKPDTSAKNVQKKDNEKFSPGEPEDYDAEKFATD